MKSRSFWIGLATALLVAAVVNAAHHEPGENTPQQHDPAVTQVISALVGGKNVYIPSTIVVVAGKPHTLSIFNTTDKPHGFSIDALKITEVLPDQVEHAVELPPLEAGVYQIHCQLHPAHRTGTLLVVAD